MQRHKKVLKFVHEPGRHVAGRRGRQRGTQHGMSLLSLQIGTFKIRQALYLFNITIRMTRDSDSYLDRVHYLQLSFHIFLTISIN